MERAGRHFDIREPADLLRDPDLAELDALEPGMGRHARPYVCIRFECCSVYQRVYRRREELLYYARCPRCLRAFRLRVASGGTSERFFVAS